MNWDKNSEIWHQRMISLQQVRILLKTFLFIIICPAVYMSNKILYQVSYSMMTHLQESRLNKNKKPRYNTYTHYVVDILARPRATCHSLRSNMNTVDTEMEGDDADSYSTHKNYISYYFLRPCLGVEYELLSIMISAIQEISSDGSTNRHDSRLQLNNRLNYQVSFSFQKEGLPYRTSQPT